MASLPLLKSTMPPMGEFIPPRTQKFEKQGGKQMHWTDEANECAVLDDDEDDLVGGVCFGWAVDGDREKGRKKEALKLKKKAEKAKKAKTSAAVARALVGRLKRELLRVRLVVAAREEWSPRRRLKLRTRPWTIVTTSQHGILPWAAACYSARDRWTELPRQGVPG